MRPNVLVVDMDRAHRERVCEALEKGLFRGIPSGSWESAAEQLEALPIAVVLCDETLPAGSGLDFLCYVRHRYPGALKVLVSQEPTLELAQAAINQAGIFLLMDKPVNTSELCAQLTAELHPKPSTRSGQLSLGGAFEHALSRLWLATQPIVSYSERRVLGYECLARSEEPGLTRPKELFALAAALKRTHELERTIWRRAAALVDDLPEDATLFVNVEAQSLDDANLFATSNPLTDVASRIVLELTEHGHLADVATAKARLAALKERGFKIAIDDFGAGQSGLNTVAALAPDVVKFDMGLIRGIESDSAKVRIVQSMCAACDALGIATVCEGVETVEQLEVLDFSKYLQGFLFAMPERPFPPVHWPEPVSATVQVRPAGDPLTRKIRKPA